VLCILARVLLRGELRTAAVSVRAAGRDGSAIVFVSFAALCCVPLAALLIRATTRGQTFAGPGASLSLLDQYRYLDWIRDASGHGLISSGGPAGSAHVYFNPVFLISGLLLHLGIGIQLSYQLWLPVAVLALFVGYRALVWRAVAPGWARPVTLALALMGSSPLLPLLDYGKVVDATGASNLVNLATHLSPYWQAWGYFPTAIALGLMPLYVLGLADAARGATISTASLVRLCAAGATVSLLDPWAGLVLSLITAALLIRAPRTIVTLLASVLAPLIYYLILAQSNPDWSLANLRTSFAPGPAWTYPVVFGPLLLAVALKRRDRRGPLDLQLWLWLGASIVMYVLLGAGARLTVLEGTSLPLAILAVSGWQRLGLPAAVSGLAVALLLLPGAAYAGATFHDYLNDDYAPYTLTAGERAAIATLPAGRVLATPYLATALPALTGRTPAAVDARRADQLFDGHLGPAAARALIARARARVLLSDCVRGRAEIDRLVAPLGFVEQRFGCARRYVRVTPLSFL
jgi:hypothetical protein